MILKQRVGWAKRPVPIDPHRFVGRGPSFFSMRLSYVPISQAKRASSFSLTVDKFVPKSVSMMMEKFVPKEAAETKSMMAMESMPTKAPADVDRASSGLG